MSVSSSLDGNRMFDDPRVIAARQAFAKYSGKAPKDPYAYDRWQMASLHALIFNSLEAVYHNCARIAHDDLANFLSVARDCFLFLEEHHSLEESLYFPALEVHYSMSTARAQHAEFLPVVEEILAYLDSADPAFTPRPRRLNPYQLRDLIDYLLLPAATHMVDELELLSPELLRQHDALPAAKAARKAILKHIKCHDDLVIAVPRMVYTRLPGCNIPSEVPNSLMKVLAVLCSWRYPGRKKYLWAMRRWEKVPVNDEWLERGKMGSP